MRKMRYLVIIWICICQLSISSEVSAQTCSGNTQLTSPSGSFDDGSANTNYSNNLSCSWHIQVSGAGAIQIDFTSFSTEPLFDTVKIYQGNDQNGILLGSFSGFVIPPSLTVRGEDAFITFSSDKTITYQGWSLQYSSLSKLCGTYTIGGLSPDYSSISAAISDLSFRGISCPVIFEIRDGAYSEQLIIPEIIGASAGNTITFRSESLDSSRVQVNYPGVLLGDPTIRLDGADHVTFDHLTISSPNGRGLSYGKGSDSCTLSNSLILLQKRRSDSDLFCGIYSENTVDEHFSLLSSEIFGGTYGALITGAAGLMENGLIIRQNTFSNQHRGAIKLVHLADPIISKNQIDILADADLECIGMDLIQCEGSSSSRGLISNNFVHLSGTEKAFGIRLQSTKFQDVVYNNVHLSNLDPKSICIHLRDTGLSNNRILNSNFYNSGGGLAIAASPMQKATVDFNNLETKGANLAYSSGSLHPNLPAWRLASGYDQNSISFDPQYTSNSDLHVAQTALNAAATPFASVTDDIDGDTRNSIAPDIGADEISVAALKISCPSDRLLNTDPGRCDRFVSGLAANVQNGSGSEVVTNSYNGSSLADDLYLLGITNVSYLVVDGANRDSCTFRVEIIDSELPGISCPKDILGPNEPGLCGASISYTQPGLSDNCPGVQLSLIAGLGSNTFFPIGKTTETYEAEDGAGNKSACSFIIEIVDNELPAISCPPTISTSTDGGLCSGLVTFINPKVSDNCPGAQLNINSGAPSGSRFPLGVTAQSYTATDAAGNQNSCSFEIRISDAEVPSINCPPDKTLTSSPGSCSVVYNYATPAGNDNCPGVQTRRTSGLGSGANYPLGLSLEAYEATDASGNSNSCSFSILVIDSEKPSISCPASQQFGTDPGKCSVSFSYSIQVSDNCPNPSTSQLQGAPSGTALFVGNHPYLFQVRDESGNSGTCTFAIIVKDLETPVLTCPPSKTIFTDPRQCDALVTYASIRFSDNCPGVTLSQSTGASSGSRLGVGNSAISYVAIDSGGLQAICSFEISVLDREPPNLSCPGAITMSTDNGQCSSIVNYSVSSADNCPGVIDRLLSGPVSGSVFQQGLTNIRYEAEDQSGNKVDCSFIVSVVDTEDPILNCPANIVVSAPPGQSFAVVTYATPSFSDNCPLNSVPKRNGLASGSNFPSGQNPISYALTDDSGNRVSCTFLITVNLVQVLGINCPPNKNVPTDTGNCSTVLTGLGASLVNASPAAQVTNSFNGGPLADDTYPLGQTNVTYLVQDAGQTASCNFEIVVNDQEFPTISCPASSTVLTAFGVCYQNVSFSNASSSDNCPGVITAQIQGMPSTSRFPSGQNLIQFEAEDASGNKSRCSFTITVVDQSPPSLFCPPDQTLFLPANTCNLIVNYNLPFTSDNCGLAGLQRSSGLGPGNIFPVGQTIETYILTDVNANVSTCAFSITVRDTVPPDINCGQLVSVNTASGQCGARVNYPLPLYSDNCPGVNLLLTNGRGSGQFFTRGISNEVYKAVDASGNEAICTLKVEVRDQELPGLSCPANIFRSTDVNRCGAVVNYNNPATRDNCPGVQLISTYASGSGAFFPVGVSMETFVAEDAAGNRVSCSFNVIINDSEAPSIQCPQNIVVNNAPGQNTAIVTYSAPSFNDNCPLQQSPVFNGIGSGGQFPVGTSVESFRISDNAGNISTCSFSVTVVFGNVLGIACPSDLMLSTDQGTCDALLTGLNPSIINASPSSIVTNDYNNTGLADDTYPLGHTIIIYTVTDGAFMATCSFSITISDQESPGISCPLDISQNADPGKCDAFINYLLPSVSDNCVGTILQQVGGNGPGTIFTVGRSIEQFEVEDQAGNKTVCSFYVDVVDSQSPVINCPQNIVVNNDPGSNSAIVTYNTPTASDNCPNLGSPRVSGLGSGASFPVGSSIEKYSVLDAAGNESTCSFTIRVILGNVLSVNCPANRNVSNDPGRCDANQNGLGASVLNASPSAVLTNSFNGSSLADGRYPVGLTRVVYTVTDNAFTASCDFVIQVDDTESPLITCPASRTVFNDPGKTTAVVNYGSPAISDNCPGSQLSLISGLVSGSAFPRGATLVRFSLRDGSNNISACSFNVMVIDTTQAPNLRTQGSASLTTSATLLNLNTTILNDGMLNAGAYNFGLYFSTDTILDAADILVRTLGLPALQPSNTQPLSISLDTDTLGLSLPIGTYHVIYHIDYDNKILEGNEFDNVVVFKTLGDRVLVLQTNVTISGSSRSHSGKDIRHVEYSLDLAGSISTFTSDQTGYYRFVVPQNSSPRITSSKNNDSLIVNGIDALDVALITEHIKASALLSGPYERIAADVDSAFGINVLDVNLIQALILGKLNTFPGNRLWSFIPSSYNFPDPNNPVGYPQSKNYPGIQTSLSSEDYIGVKLGDVNDSRDPALAILPSVDTLTLSARNKTFLPGQSSWIPFYVSGAESLMAGQMEISYDPKAFRFKDMRSGLLDLQSYEPLPGIVRVVWVVNTNRIINDGEVLIEMEFTAIGSAGEKTLIQNRKGYVPTRIYKRSEAPMTLSAIWPELSIENITDISDRKKERDLRIFPNPSRDEFTLYLEAEGFANATLRIIDLQGKEILNYEISPGDKTSNLSSRAFLRERLTAGSYIVELNTGETTKRAKLIIQQ